MRCPHCQTDLVEIPTSETPQLDVCPRGHGLWLDEAEINFFVEDYRALKAAVEGAGSVAVHTKTAACPRCGSPLDSETVSDASRLACRSCRGWWLPSGSLTRLNLLHRGTGLPIRVNESAFYARAAARRTTPGQPGVPRSGFSPAGTGPQGLWFWMVFFGICLVVAGLVLFAGIRKTFLSARWGQAPDEPLLYLLFGVIGGIALFLYGFTINRRKHLIESIPTSTVRSLAVGLVEVAGKAQVEEALLNAPFSGMPCVFFSYTVKERIGTGKNARWVTLAKGTSDQPFFVRDGTGIILVIPFGAELIVGEDRTYRNEGFGSLSATATAGLNRLGISTGGWLGERTLRCRESFILPDETVYVLGTAQENLAASASAGNPERLYIGSSRDNLFIISDRSEKELLAALQWQVVALLYGGPALTLACLFVILTRYVTAGQ